MPRLVVTGRSANFRMCSNAAMSGDAKPRHDLIFLTVLIFHAALVLLLVRVDKRPAFPSIPANQRLELLPLTLPATRRRLDLALPRPVVEQPLFADSPKTWRDFPLGAEAETDIPSPERQSPATVDWQIEMILAAQSTQKRDEQQSRYRDLSRLSPAQLAWMRQNHLVPAPPGVRWQERRFEMTQEGYILIHINDSCVVVPLMAFLVFCRIGHIESNGDMLDHMRDPH